MRDYIYIPLGGNRYGTLRTYSNLLIAFILGGIWHGAGWTFVFWGLLHGIALVVHRFWKSLGFKLPTVVAWFITFNFINIAWVFFRAKDWESAFRVLGGMVDRDTIVISQNYERFFSYLPNYDFLSFGNVTQTIGGGQTLLAYLIVTFVGVLLLKNSNQIIAYPKLDNRTLLTRTHALYFAVLFMYSVLNISIAKYSEFIYFNF